MARKLGRRSLLASLSLLLGASCVEPEAEPLVPQLDPQGGRPVTAQPFAVHEWGTFTTLQGSLGGSLDGLQHETEGVPDFVLRNVQASADPFAAFGALSRNVPVRRVNSKMETPVIYFYAPDERRVEVEVDFAGGLMTHWYPGHAWASPEIEATGGAPIDVTKLDKTTLRWDVTLSRRKPAEVPDVPEDDGWHFARETQASWVRTASRAGADSTPQADRYLFYRGLGRLDLPMRVTALPGSMNVVVNEGHATIPVAFVIEMKASQGRFVRLAELPKSDSRAAPLGGQPLRDKKTVVSDLERDVLSALVEQGLFEDEARAMVRTWSRAWFGSEGTRVVYVVPREITDEVLPMRITPPPDKLVRVLVGRHEFLAPEVEREVEAALRDRESDVPAKRADAMKRLARVDRFLEPAVRRIRGATQDPVVRQSADEVLRAYQP